MVKFVVKAMNSCRPNTTCEKKKGGARKPPVPVVTPQGVGPVMDRKQYNRLILVLASLSAMGPFSVDMYLPGFPAIAADLNTDIAHVGLSLTTYFIGICVGQIAYGPIMDRYGRKGPLILGLLVYIAAALGCAASKSISWLIGLRLLLALGAGVGVTGSRAIVRDLFSGAEIARVMSLLMAVFGIAPIIAPSIGGLVAAALGWRAIFLVLAAIATAVLIAVGILLRESKGADTAVSLKPVNIVRQYAEVFRHREFVTYTLASSAAMGGFFAYITGAPFAYMKLLGFTEAQFGWIYGANVLGLIVASQINRALLKRRTSLDVLLRAQVVHLGVSVALIISAQPRLGSITGIAGLIFCYLFLMGFIGPNGMALALDPFTRNAASASAMMGSLQMVAGASASGLVSYLHNGTALPMVCVMAGCTCLGLLVLCESAIFAKRQPETVSRR